MMQTRMKMVNPYHLNRLAYEEPFAFSLLIAESFFTDSSTK
jgi:hypothetical protein